MIHSCLTKYDLSGESCQPCEAPLCGCGVDHSHTTDKMTTKQEWIKTAQSQTDLTKQLLSYRISNVVKICLFTARGSAW